MKRAAFIIVILVMWLSTCRAAENIPAPMEIIPTQTSIPATETQLPPTPTDVPVSEGKLPAPLFDAQPYIDEAAGFALDYPTGWTVVQTVVGPRGTQVQFLSSPELAEAATLPDGSTRISAVIYQWDPKNDLDAYIQQRKTAWDASGFTIVEEQSRTLELGLPAVLFIVQMPDTKVIFLITTLKDQYLVISGEGDLELAKQILERVRPISS